MYEYKAQVIRVVDGDSVIVNVDLGFKVHVDVTFRMLGINAPELHGATHVAGENAKNHLIGLLALGPLTVKSLKPLTTDRYGRWLGQFFVTKTDGTIVDVNAAMIADGFAVPFMV